MNILNAVGNLNTVKDFNFLLQNQSIFVFQNRHLQIYTFSDCIKERIIAITLYFYAIESHALVCAPGRCFTHLSGE